MNQPVRTPNPATSSRPERSSRRVAHRRALGWLPWALLGLLLAVLALTALAVRWADRDPGPAAAGSGATAGSGPTAGSGATAGSGGTAGATAPGPGTTGALAAVSDGALVGGGGVPAAPASSASSVLSGTRESGTAGTVLFGESRVDVDAAGARVVTAAADALRRAGAHRVEVVGYTDEVAGSPVNQPLSQQRAEAVAALLRRQLPGVEVTASARGQQDPIAPNDTAQGRQQNRRAAIVARA